jgi:hypothetical protein
MQPPHHHPHPAHGAWDGGAGPPHQHPHQQQHAPHHAPHLPQLGGYAPTGGHAHASPQLGGGYYASGTPSGSATPSLPPPHSSPAPHAQQWAPRHPDEVQQGYYPMQPQPQPQPQPQHAAWSHEGRQLSQPGVPLKDEDEGDGATPLRRNQACLSCRKRKVRGPAVLRAACRAHALPAAALRCRAPGVLHMRALQGRCRRLKPPGTGA